MDDNPDGTTGKDDGIGALPGHITFLNPDADPPRETTKAPEEMDKEIAPNTAKSEADALPDTKTGPLRAHMLPWTPNYRHVLGMSAVGPCFDGTTSGPVGNSCDPTTRPGEIVMRNLFADFTQQAEKKIESVMCETADKNLSKLLQRGEDAQFDQLLSTLGSVAEHCLPSLLTTLLAWRNRQLSNMELKMDLPSTRNEKLIAKDVDIQITNLRLLRREAAVEFIFCLALIEILKQLPFHPGGHEELVHSIENLAFKHFKYREGLQINPNAHNFHIISDLYAEVIGVLAQSRFVSVKKRFLQELKELRSKESSPTTTQGIISLLMGMKFFRVKMVPIEEFEASFQFMHECAQYFLEVKDKDIKHALAGLFVEVLVPVAAAVKNEVNVPCVKNFVDLLYSQTLDACTKSKHRLALFPLVTCLLCVSQKTFFLNNWHYFLAMCLSNLKNRDAKMSRVALESLYRLLWVYMIRIKCESNQATHSRLQSIVNSLFPRGSKAVMPRETPLNIFVKIIQFIAAERLDFAMREIVFELLWVGRPIKIIMTPERMSIGLRAFLVVADSLQQKDGEPPMPRTVGVLPSGSTLRVKKTYLNKMLTEDTARTIGMSNYFPHVRAVFVDMLRALDVQFGRPLMMTNQQNANKEPDELMTTERKPKIDLFRTCIAAVPRLIPDNMTRNELVDLLARLTVHMDEELRGLAYQSLLTLVIDFADWRQDVVHGFAQFLARDVPDTHPQLVDNGLRMLLIFLNTWRNATSVVTSPPASKPSGTLEVVREATGENKSSSMSSTNSSYASSASNATQSSTESDKKTVVEPPLKASLHLVEGLALVSLCNTRSYPRKLAVHILKETKLLSKLIGTSEEEPPVIDIIDNICFQLLVERCQPMLPQTERIAVLSANTIDLQWVADRTNSIWTIGEDQTKSSSLFLNEEKHCDPWATLLYGLMERGNVPHSCPAAVNQAWTICCHKVTSLFAIIDPTPVSDNRASLLRSTVTPKKNPLEGQRDTLTHLWKNQLAMAMQIIPPIPSVAVRCASPDLSISIQDQGSPSSVATGGTDSKSLSDSMDNIPSQFFGPDSMITRFTLPLSYGRREFRKRGRGSSPDSLTTDRSEKTGGTTSPIGLYKLVVPLIRSESEDVRDAVINALGLINHASLKDLMDVLGAYIREAIDRKQENMRRRRRRDTLRLHLVQVFMKIAENGTFGASLGVVDAMTLHSTFVEYIEGARSFLENENDKDNSCIRCVKIHFCDFIRLLIKNFPMDTASTVLSRDLKHSLFNMFAMWSGPFAKPLKPHFMTPATTHADEEKLQYAALQAQSAVLTCGPCFDPQYLAEDGILYNWLDALLNSSVDKVYQMAQDTVVLLLECNPDQGQLLEWVIDRCYTAGPREADACFLSLATIFSARDYPCDHYTSVINITLFMTGCPRTNIHTTALHLLQILDKRFFGTIGPLRSDSDLKEGRNIGTLDAILSNAYCRSQMYLSKQLAQIRPELTMPMFSEITHRFQTARFDARQLLIQCLLPWLENVELVATCVPPNAPLSYIMYFPDSGNKGKKEGSGSTEATEMILNNLFYITVKFSDTHGKCIEGLWGTLCQYWPNNIKVTLRYLVIISGMAPTELLVYAKRVALYLARTCPSRLMDELMIELQTIETLNCLIERTETPPFYRLTSMRKTSSQVGNYDAKHNESVEKGTIHTKRHSGEDPSRIGTCKSDSGLRMFASSYHPPRGCDKIRAASGPSVLPRAVDMFPGIDIHQDGSVELRNPTREKMLPNPLPMPEYGGYFAPLTEFLPSITTPSSGFHRCNVAVMLLSDVIGDGIPGVDWTLHIPSMLHIAFLGLDHTRLLVRDHCKELLLNMLTVLADHNDHLTVSRILLNCNASARKLGLPITHTNIVVHNFTEPDEIFDKYLSVNPNEPLGGNDADSLHFEVMIEKESGMEGRSIGPENLPIGIIHEKFNKEVLPENSEIVSPENIEIPSTGGGIEKPKLNSDHVVKSLIRFLGESQNQSQPLWNFEDITAKVWTIKSADQMSCLLRHFLKIFSDSYTHSRVSERWAQTALQLGLSCSSRHYAGRSLQLFRALNIPITTRMLSDILSRLVETVAEQGEDMQGYVTELLLTLEAAVDSLDSDFRPLDVMKDIFKSTPNLNNKESMSPLSATKKILSSNLTNTGQSSLGIGKSNTSAGHTRSTSYSVSYSARKNNDKNETRIRSSVMEKCDISPVPSSLSRSRSAQSLKLISSDSITQDDKLTILAQLFWLAVSLLESDYEHEFQLALRLLTRVLYRLPLERPDARDKVEKLQQQLKWNGYPGVHALLLKGCTNPATYESTVALLSQLAPLLSMPVCDPTQSAAFPMNVIALLPYMLLHYEEANEVCIRSAERIAQVAAELGAKLENLGTVMNLYSRKTFSKESFQWTKCVVKYLHDTYAHLGLHMLAFLVEVLERGWHQVQLQVLSIIHCMLHYIDLSSAQSRPIAEDLLRVVSKMLDGVHWKEARKILKLIVTRSSSLQVPQTLPPSERVSTLSFFTHGSHSDTEMVFKKELAGRTMDFTFDVNQTPLIGRKILLKDGEPPVPPYNTINAQMQNTASSVTPNSPRRSLSVSPAESVPLTGWKRPWMSQARVRECLVNLLTTCGQRVGLPKSPSVIFSQSSDLLERQSSAASSTDDTSGPNQDLSGGSRRDDAQPDFGVFKDFDFLEYESESIEGESTDNFNWGVRRRLLSDESEPLTSGCTSSLKSTPTDISHEKTPISKRKKQFLADDSSDDEDGESESPIDEDHRRNMYMVGGPPNMLNLRERPRRRGSISRSDTSGSSAGDLGDLTPCNISPHMPGPLSFRTVDNTEEVWRINLHGGLILNQTSGQAAAIANQLYTMTNELISKSVSMARECVEFLAGNNMDLGNRMMSLVDLLATKGELTRLWLHPDSATSPRLHEQLRFGVLEIQEHLETFFDRKDHVKESMDLAKARFVDPGMTGFIHSPHRLSTRSEVQFLDGTIEMGRSVYKLLFQLLLLIESSNKIVNTIIQNIRQDLRLEDHSEAVESIRSAIVRGLEEENESVDTDGDYSTPTPSPVPTGCTMSYHEFETTVFDLVENRRWGRLISQAKQFIERTENGMLRNIMCSGVFEVSKDDIVSFIVQVYARRLVSDRGDIYILSKTEVETSETHTVLMENLLRISTALNTLESRKSKPLGPVEPGSTTPE